MKLRKNLVLPLAVGIILGSVTTVTAGTWVSAYKNTEMTIKYNGQAQRFVDSATGEVQTPIMYNDRTYLPVRAVAEMLGVNVDYDGNTQTVILKTDDYVEPSTPSTPSTPEVTFDLSKDTFANSFTYYSTIPSGYYYDYSSDVGFTGRFDDIFSYRLKSYTDSNILEMLNKKSPVYDEMYKNLLETKKILLSNPSIKMDTSNTKVEKYAFSGGLLRGAIVSGDINLYNNGTLVSTQRTKLLLLPDYERGINFAIYCEIID